MAEYSQDNRWLYISTPLEKDKLLMSSFEGDEHISGLFHFQLDLRSQDDAIDPKTIVGKNVTLRVVNHDESERFFNGYITRFVYCGAGDRLNIYRAEMRPWLWFLSRRSNCRLMPPTATAPDIIKHVFDQAGFKDYEIKGARGPFRTRDICIQLNETDLDFVNRIMEEEGLFYYWRHENGKHTMVIGDHASAYADCDEQEVIFTKTQGVVEGRQDITRWEHAYEFTTGKVAQRDWNFETPGLVDHESKSVVKLDGNDGYEFYDFPGDFADRDEAKELTKRRIEIEEAGHDIVRGDSYCRSFMPGHRFTLTRHQSTAEEGKTYVLTSVHHFGHQRGAYVTGGSGADESIYQNQFTCIPSLVTYRPPRVTPRPVIHGAQTAIVVGAAGDEIHTDKFGRIRVQFHWDRDGKLDDKSSCWIRVAQLWAGKNWGSMFIPRVGMEVLVTFLNGNPDEPVVTGCVYNKASEPPYELGANKTISGIKTNSTKGGGGFNEIRFEDKKDDEQIFVHAQKNMDVRVKESRYELMGMEQHEIVETDKFLKVDNNRHETVGNDHMEQIGKDRHVAVAGAEAISVGGDQSIQVGGAVTETIGGGLIEDVTGDAYIKASGNIILEAGAGITLKVGGNSIVISSGSVVATSSSMLGINGNPVLINSGGVGVPGMGTPAMPQDPTAPEKAKEADEADPGETADIKAVQKQQGKGKYGETKAPPYIPSVVIHAADDAVNDDNDEDNSEEPVSVELELVDEMGQPIAGEKYEIKLPDGSVASGTTDAAGKAKVEGIDPGDCEITFPELDTEAWEKG